MWLLIHAGLKVSCTNDGDLRWQTIAIIERHNIQLVYEQQWVTSLSVYRACTLWRELHRPPFCCLNYDFNFLRPIQNRRHFSDDVFKCNFMENVSIPIIISLTFVPDGPIINIPALVPIMAWRLSGAKPLSEPMMTQFNDAYMRHSMNPLLWVGSNYFRQDELEALGRHLQQCKLPTGSVISHCLFIPV